jgi:hypothetical protein
MKFFFSQMEMSKEAIRVGTLTLIKALVSMDGEHQWGRQEGQDGGREGDSTYIRATATSSFVDTAGWANGAKFLGCFILSNIGT